MLLFTHSLAEVCFAVAVVLKVHISQRVTMIALHASVD